MRVLKTKFQPAVSRDYRTWPVRSSPKQMDANGQHMQIMRERFEVNTAKCSHFIECPALVSSQWNLDISNVTELCDINKFLTTYKIKRPSVRHELLLF